MNTSLVALIVMFLYVAGLPSGLTAMSTSKTDGVTDLLLWKVFQDASRRPELVPVHLSALVGFKGPSAS